MTDNREGCLIQAQTPLPRWEKRKDSGATPPCDSHRLPSVHRVHRTHRQARCIFGQTRWILESAWPAPWLAVVSVVAGAVAVGVNDSILWQHLGKCRGYPRSKRESEVDLVDVGMVDIDQLPRTERRGSREIRGGVEEWTGRLLGKGTSRDSICHPSI